jgi:RNA polymerase sigma-70 factor (ECF subfamily)
VRAEPERCVTAADDPIGGTPDDAPDEALVRATLWGDADAFARLVRRYLRKAMAVALEYVGNREDAEDVVQDTFRRALEQLDRFDASRSFGPWFFTILRNTARNALKSRRVRQHEALGVEHPSGAADPLEELHRLELRRDIDDAIDRLPAMQKTCFRLCAVEGLTSVEAAHAVGLAESTVRVHVFKARRTLQRLLDLWRMEAEGK